MVCFKEEREEEKTEKHDRVRVRGRERYWIVLWLRKRWERKDLGRAVCFFYSLNIYLHCLNSVMPGFRPNTEQRSLNSIIIAVNCAIKAIA